MLLDRTSLPIQSECKQTIHYYLSPQTGTEHTLQNPYTTNFTTLSSEDKYRKPSDQDLVWQWWWWYRHIALTHTHTHTTTKSSFPEPVNSILKCFFFLFISRQKVPAKHLAKFVLPMGPTQSITLTQMHTHWS